MKYVDPLKEKNTVKMSTLKIPLNLAKMTIMSLKILAAIFKKHKFSD
jgi:hypothetical protein